ncbi:MAG: hypothetical protein HC821_03605 [Lewinella sp.]|nr:hypothetical protein [Lewinella sp.]
MGSSFFEQINRHQASMWRHYIGLDLGAALEEAQNCYTLFQLNSEMQVHDPDLFLRVLYYVNAFGYLLSEQTVLKKSAQRLAQFVALRAGEFNENSQRVAFIYLQLCQLNVWIGLQDWEAAANAVAELEAKASKRLEELPHHRRYLFCYKFAVVAAANRHHGRAQDYLNDILNAPPSLLREDLLIHSRLLLIISYYETQDYYLADYAVTNLSRIIRQNRHAGQVHRFTLAALRRLLREPQASHRSIFAGLASELQSVCADSFEAKCLRFLDVTKWVEAKLK